MYHKAIHNHKDKLFLIIERAFSLLLLLIIKRYDLFLVILPSNKKTSSYGRTKINNGQINKPKEAMVPHTSFPCTFFRLISIFKI